MPNLLCMPRHFSAMTATTRPRASWCGEPGLLHSPAASKLLPMLQHRQEAHNQKPKCAFAKGQLLQAYGPVFGCRKQMRLWRRSIPSYLHVWGMSTEQSGTETTTSPTGRSLIAKTPRTVTHTCRYSGAWIHCGHVQLLFVFTSSKI